MKKIVTKFASKDSARGQSLVETAIIAPLLVFFILGIFEVGWALRNYFVLVNVNREITRFAVRPGYLDFSTEDDIITSFDRVAAWTGSSVSEQLILDFRDTGDIADTGSTTLIVSHAVIDTGLACNDPGTCNCDNLAEDDLFKQDDLILHPGLPSYGYQSSQRPDADPPGFANLAGFGPEETVTGVRSTRIDFDTLVDDLAAKNNEFNCKLMKKGGVPSSNNLIVTEIYHDQPQLFGFPLISNPYSDPVPLYTHTVMRLVSAARSTGGIEGSITEGIDTIGPVCLVYPFIVQEPVGASPKNIIEHGWLKWGNMFTDNEEYLQNSLLYPQMSLNDFTQPGGIQTGTTVDLVSLSLPDPDPDIDIATVVENLLGRKIIIPTTASPPGGGQALVSGFVYATIASHDLVNSPNTVMANFDTVTALPSACQ